MADISPELVLSNVAVAIPKKIRKHITIVGSLAAGYVLRSRINQATVRTKDIDCVLFPFATASVVGAEITSKLLTAGWTLRQDEEFSTPGNKSTSIEKLPVVRLNPPGSDEWFLELLTVPSNNTSEVERFTRLEVDADHHYVLPSFKFLPIAIFEPIETTFGVYCARVEMMALANLLENPTIKPMLMRGLIAGRKIKRSNKDLGRAVALARICDEEIESWPESWLEALRSTFPDNWQGLGIRVGDGVNQLASSEDDIEQACLASNNGLLSYAPSSVEQFRLTIKRLHADCISPFINLCSRERRA